MKTKPVPKKKAPNFGSFLSFNVILNLFQDLREAELSR